MDFGRLFTRSASLVWRRRFLWVLGLFASLGTAVTVTARLWLTVRFPSEWIRTPLRWLTETPSLNELIDVLLELLVSGLLIFFVGGALLWLVMTAAEAALIWSVNQLGQGKSAAPGEAARQGWRWLGRFIAIDALVFVPLFIFLLLLELIPFVFLLLFFVGVSEGTAPEATNMLAVVGGAVTSFLCFLAVPLTVLTSLYRTLAFRDAVVSDHDVRTAVRQPWRVVRSQLGNVLVVTVVLWGAGRLVTFGLTILTAPLTVTVTTPRLLSLLDGSLSAGPFLPEPLAALLALATGLITLFITAVMHAFVAAAWTLAYREMALLSES